MVKTDSLRIGQQRSKSRLPLLALGLSHHTHRAVRRAVVGTSHRDHLRASRIALGKFQRTLHSLGSRVKEIDRVEGIGQSLGEQLRELHLRALDHLAIDHNVHILCGLALHSLHDGPICVADIAHRHTRDQIVIGLTLGRIEKDTLSTLDLDKLRRGRGLRNVAQELFS